MGVKLSLRAAQTEFIASTSASGKASPAVWDRIAARSQPSWYLDPLVAEQKRQAHLDLIRRWIGSSVSGTVLKTDLFEEAYGRDRILFGLFPGAQQVIGVDVSSRTVHAARARCLDPNIRFVVSDVRHLPLLSGSVDLILSTSTLDHLGKEEHFQEAIAELCRLLRPGGTVVITLDNPENPLFHVLRWVSRLGWAPFPLGFTASRRQLNSYLSEEGLEVLANEWLIHNPRLFSTAIVLTLRKILGRHGDILILGLLRLFALLGHLPSRRFTACFVAACARKPMATAGEMATGSPRRATAGKRR